MYIHTHTHRFNGHFPGKPRLGSCALNSPAPFIPELQTRMYRKNKVTMVVWRKWSTEQSKIQNVWQTVVRVDSRPTVLSSLRYDIQNEHGGQWQGTTVLTVPL